MIVLNISSCPPSLRGDLSKWLLEINTGVYIGKVSARVREELWDRICENIRDGQATMIYSAANAQGFEILVHNTTWIPKDFDGITLMQRPIRQEQNDDVDLKPGFSKASRYERAKRSSKSAKSAYVVLDLETTGLKAESDRILEIGMLKIIDAEIAESYQCLIKQDLKIPKSIVKLTGITDQELQEKGIIEESAVRKVQEFVGTYTVVGYNIKFDIGFIRETCRRHNMEINIRKTKDVLDMARRKLEDVENYKLETVAKYFDSDAIVKHRALSDCELVQRIYSKLNEI